MGEDLSQAIVSLTIRADHGEHVAPPELGIFAVFFLASLPVAHNVAPRFGIPEAQLAGGNTDDITVLLMQAEHDLVCASGHPHIG